MSSGLSRVALCVTCLVDQFMPEVGVATVRILRRAGFEVDFPQDQTCCGQPFFNSGFRQQALTLAMRTIEIFEPYPTVVLPSGSCTAMIRVEYPHLLAREGQWFERARQLAAKTFELSEFLAQTPAATGIPEASESPAVSESVTYHDSCHMRRLLGLTDEPRRALRDSGYSLHEIEESDRCCGFGGLFSLRLPEVANAMTAEKLGRAAETGATLVTADPGCLIQLRGLADEVGVTVEHLAVVLDRQSQTNGVRELDQKQ